MNERETKRGALPDDTATIVTHSPPRSAGGLGALVSSLRHVKADPGLLRATRSLLAINQPGGFDCPGCAWPETNHQRPMAEFCENGVKAVAWETSRERIGQQFFAENSVASLLSQSDHWLGMQGRLGEPMFLDEGDTHYRPIGWDRAFEMIGAELNTLSSPDEASFYTSGRTSNEAAFLYQLFVRQFGTNNLPDCSNMCHESSGTALKESIGVGKGTVSLDDFAIADAIFVIGQNPGTNHPRMMTTLQEAAERGCKIVSINPLPEVALLNFEHPQQPMGLLGHGTPISTLFLPVKVGGDAALFKGIAKAILEREQRKAGAILDHAFIAEHTTGFPELAAHLEALDWEGLCHDSGIARESIEAAADIAIKARHTIACWAMGLTQHENSVAIIQDVVNFMLLRGNLGRPGAGVCPVRGHSNVQGDRTMGIYEKMPEAFLSALEQHFSFSAPRDHGLDTVDTIAAMARGEVKIMIAMGGNFVSATPDTEAVADALSRCRLTVQISTKLNRAHLITGRRALILPCLGRTERDRQEGEEQFVTVEDSMGVVHASRGHLEPATTSLRSEPSIVAAMASATLGTRSKVPWLSLVENYDRIRDHIGAVIPGFDNFNERVRAPYGFVLPNAARVRVWDTESAKAQFTVSALPENQRLPDQLVLTTLRSHDQFNTTIYGLDDRYRGVRGGRKVVFMNIVDMQTRCLANGALVDLTSHFRGKQRTVRRWKVVEYPIPQGCAAAYFPEANPLVPLQSVAKKSNTPTSKAIVITVAPSAPSS
jgi:molybdopterin-dependent oxidoreductase alpha subunit